MPLELSPILALLLMLPAASGKEVNVLFIPVDDLKPLLGCYGCDDVHTPNIDRLAARGTVFINNSCQQAVCGPSRASLMTGRYPDSTQVFDLETRMRDKNPDILSLPQYLRQNGYQTTGIGKTYDPRCVDKMLDEPSWSIPYKKNVSFPEGLTPPAGGYLNPVTMKEQQRVNALMRENGIKEKTAKQQFYREFAGYRPATECMEVSDLNYPDGNNTTEALKMMKELAESDKPFFLTVGYAKPHLPFIAPKNYWDLYDREKVPLTDKPGTIPGLPSWVYNPGGELRSGYTGIPLQGELPEAMQRELIHGYLACVSYVDAQIGRLLDGLRIAGSPETPLSASGATMAGISETMETGASIRTSKKQPGPR